MSRSLKKHVILALTLMMATQTSTSLANTEKNTKANALSQAMVAPQLFEKVKANDNWKLAFATAQHAQIVFMSVSPTTNPKNEIGMETHAFDQVIIIVEGRGKAVLNGKTSAANAGDMIFIPEGTAHNIINVDKNKPLKLISFYSNNDIPANSVIKKKADEAKD